MIFSIAILAVSLSLDALGVGVVYGLRRIRIPLVPKLVICFFSIFYSGASLLIGKYLSAILPVYVSKAIGITILILMGTWIIIQALLKKEDTVIPGDETAARDETLVKIVIKSLGITIHIIKNPIECDIDKSGVIDISESLLLGFALSVDAIGAGIGSALAGFRSMFIPISVGLCQLTFLYAGTYLGEKFSTIEKINKKALSALPGILLIFLAFMRFR